MARQRQTFDTSLKLEVVRRKKEQGPSVQNIGETGRVSLPPPLRSRTALALLLLFPAAIATANAGRTDYLLAYRSNETTHGLYEIREAGANFLNRERPNRDRRIKVIEPDILIVVSRCAVPLTTHWGRELPPYEREAVVVVCSKTNTQYEPTWDIVLPIYDPVVEANWRNEQKQKKSADAQKKQSKR